MENNIGIGILVALTFTSTVFVINTEYYTKSQKIILYLLFLFPPAQWILGAILLLWNKENDKTEGFNLYKFDNQIDELRSLRNKGLLTESEYVLKSKQIRDKKQTIFFEQTKEYKTLKKLKDQNILTEKEFLEKTELLKSSLGSTVEAKEESLKEI
ncbi:MULTISPECIES: SHOCT domain-containing protein [unclassified Polaribacter]|uniref:SHOCT domain-containing protein n=1 Tax=unclassified Polaribacter TaxID=196858 RepID=UPI0011BDD52F|nr:MULTISPECIES: SHOCT domain-containing protein [unclassified Polaribacter]TXD47113.1 hypothetical protein ES043_18325 [Polaribacter sp. IC063]TXD55736.1 hypothetical protein ES044_17740 [Polaribacter sp. IC066]